MKFTEIINEQITTIESLTSTVNGQTERVIKLTDLVQKQSNEMYETRNRAMKEVLDFAESLIGTTDDDLKKFITSAKKRYYIS